MKTSFSFGINFKLFLILFCICFSLTAEAQVEDAGLWTGVGIEKKFTQKFSVNLTQELRLQENFTEIGTIFSDVGLSWKFNENVKISGNYRFIQRRQVEEYYHYDNRFYGDLTLRKDFAKRIALINRIRYQSQSNFYDGEENDIPEQYLREMLTLKYQTEKRYKPYIGGEIFYNIPFEQPENGKLDEFRVRTGIDYQLNTKNNFDFFYMVKKEINVRRPNTDYIVGINYKFSF